MNNVLILVNVFSLSIYHTDLLSVCWPWRACGRCCPCCPLAGCQSLWRTGHCMVEGWSGTQTLQARETKHDTKNEMRHSLTVNLKNSYLERQICAHTHAHTSTEYANVFTSVLKTQNGFPGQQSSFTLSSASDANKTSICSSCRRRETKDEPAERRTVCLQVCFSMQTGKCWWC